MAAPARPSAWDVWVDTGGTFTDCLARDPDGRLHRAKVLSSSRLRGRVTAAGGRELNSPLVAGLPVDFLRGYGFRLLRQSEPALPVVASDPASGKLALADDPPLAPRPDDPFELVSPEEAPLLATRLVTGRRLEEPLPPVRMRLATTRGTNALLERRGAATALFITRGFADLLRIGNQQRPELFALRIVKPEPLYAVVVEVDERLDAVGEAVRELDLEPLRERARELVAAGVDSAAVALLHSYRQPAHERRVARCLRRAGFRHVSTSAELAPFIRIVPRAETTVVDAYLAEIIDDYRERVSAPLGAGSLHLMTSAGGLVRAAEFAPKDSLLSGPAGGVVGAMDAGRRSGLERVIAFDMGGTSTDVSRHDERLSYRFETRVGPARLLAPALAIETVAAGGGSICSLAGGRLRVGPRSAGASPGPACYGAGGPLTLTDVNLLLGRLDPERLRIPVDGAAAAAAAAALAAELGRAGDGDDAGGETEGEGPAEAPSVLLAGCLQIANETMAQAVRRISTREGCDPAAYALVAFGGAGPQHACGLAELLGIERCLVPADAGLLSAHGLGAARIERFAERQVLRPLAAVADRVEEWLERLEAEAVRRLGGDGVEPRAVEIRRRPVELRLAGQDSSLLVEAGSGSLADAFAAAYRERFGYPPPARPLELVSLRVVASSARSPAAPAAEVRERRARPITERRAWLGGRWRRAAIFERSGLAPGEGFRGPALVVEDHSTTVVEVGWRGRVDGAGGLLLRRERAREAAA